MGETDRTLGERDRSGALSDKDNPPDPIRTGDGIAGVAVGNTVLFLWTAAAALERVEWLIRECDKFLKQRTTPSTLLLLILSSSNPPDAAARNRLKTYYADRTSQIHQIISIPIGNAFWASIVRTIMRSMLLFSGQSIKQLVASNMAEGIRSARSPLSASTPSEAELIAAVDSLFSALGETRPS